MNESLSIPLDMGKNNVQNEYGDLKFVKKKYIKIIIIIII